MRLRKFFSAPGAAVSPSAVVQIAVAIWASQEEEPERKKRDQHDQPDPLKQCGSSRRSEVDQDQAKQDQNAAHDVDRSSWQICFHVFLLSSFLFHYTRCRRKNLPYIAAASYAGLFSRI